MRPILAALAALTPLFAGASPTPVHFICAGRPALCDALAESLARAADRPVQRFDAPDPGRDAGRLTITFATGAAGPDHLAGHLSWRRADGRRGAGPPVALSISDADLSAASFGRYADALVSESRPPF